MNDEPMYTSTRTYSVFMAIAVHDRDEDEIWVRVDRIESISPLRHVTAGDPCKSSIDLFSGRTLRVRETAPDIMERIKEAAGRKD